MQKKAQFYIYWKVHKKCFSVKYRGKVIAHRDSLSVSGAEFRVSEKGRQRVLREKRKSVHAYIVADRIDPLTPDERLSVLLDGFDVTYNPYKHTAFVDTKWEIAVNKARWVILKTNMFNKPVIVAAI
jgi:hypothetical protein